MDSYNPCRRCGGRRDLTLGDRVQVLTCRTCGCTVTWIDPEQAERLRQELAAERSALGGH